MPRKLPEEFEGKEIAPLCIAARPWEAEKIESLLDKEEIDYTFEIAPFTGEARIGAREGVLFFVYSGQLSFCRNLLRAANLSYLVVNEAEH